MIDVQLGLPPVTARTLYDRLGDYVPWTAVGIAGLAAAIGLVRARRDRLRPPAPARPDQPQPDWSPPAGPHTLEPPPPLERQPPA